MLICCSKDCSSSSAGVPGTSTISSSSFSLPGLVQSVGLWAEGFWSHGWFRCWTDSEGHCNAPPQMIAVYIAQAIERFAIHDVRLNRCKWNCGCCR